MKVRCYAMYGLIGGPFPYGFYYSAGLDVLAEKLSSLSSQVEVIPAFGWSEWKKIVRDVESQPKDTRIVAYGHSMGANQLAAVASKLSDRTIHLLAAFDPTFWYPMRSIKKNVNHVIWFRGTSLLSIAGHGRIKVDKTFRGLLERVDVNQRHEKIDDNIALHEKVISSVRKLI